MNPWQLALLGGAGYLLPLAGWLIGGLEPTPVGLDLDAAADLTALAQVATLVLLLPGLLPAPASAGSVRGLLGHASGPALLLVMLAWPLLAVPWLAGVPAGRLLLGQSAVLATTLLAVIALASACRAGPAATGALQLAALAGLAALAKGLLGGPG